MLKACLLGSGADAALIDDPVALNIAMVLRSLAPIDDLHEALLRVIRFSFKQALVPCLASMSDTGLSRHWPMLSLALWRLELPCSAAVAQLKSHMEPGSHQRVVTAHGG